MSDDDIVTFKVREKECRKQIPVCELKFCSTLPGTSASWYLLKPGIAVVRGAIDKVTQRWLITTALKELPFQYVSNLSKDYYLDRNPWEMYVSKSDVPVFQRSQQEREQFLSHPPPCQLAQMKEPREHISSTSNHSVNNSGDVCCTPGIRQANSSEEILMVSTKPIDPVQENTDVASNDSCRNIDRMTSKPSYSASTHTQIASIARSTAPGSSLLTKLRSLNIGYRFNWFTREYSDGDFLALPPELDTFFRNLCMLTSPIHGAPEMNPEAIVVNYYKHNDRMMGHVDDSETATTPLLSVSLGADGLFLCGSPPRCARLISGDLVVMYGNGRQDRHAVPRILASSAFLNESTEDHLESTNMGQSKTSNLQNGSTLTSPATTTFENNQRTRLPKSRKHPETVETAIGSLSTLSTHLGLDEDIAMYMNAVGMRININARQIYAKKLTETDYASVEATVS
eukprot:gene828-4108_t